MELKLSKNKVFCAFCRLSRTAYLKRHLGWSNVLLSLLFSLLIMLAAWQSFEPKFILIFVFAMIAAEVFLQMRWRMTIVCPHCGFDPVLYIQSPEKASERVIKKLDQRRDSGELLLRSNNPFQSLPKKKAEKFSKSGQYLSKQI